MRSAPLFWPPAPASEPRGHFARWRYDADGGDVEIWHEGGVGDFGYTAIQFRRSALEKAAAIREIARRESPHVKIIFGPPFDD